MRSALRTDDFDYAYPPDTVAQRPLPDRSASRMLVLDRTSGRVSHRTFADFPALLDAGDVLVRNVSRVMPARLRGRRQNGRDAELLLIHPEPDGSWLVMAHPGGKLKPGRTVSFGDDAQAEIVAVLGGGLRRARFSGRLAARELMERYGTTPLPPYIHRIPEPADGERYQTVYASEEGSVAAPTAGLHFTAPMLEAIVARGVEVVDVVLHVGPGTFKPVTVDDPDAHRMHPEWYRVDADAATAVSAAKRDGRRVWAVGTTATRTLEACAVGHELRAGSGWTDLFIRPPFTFRLVDALLTNFHLPRSTLLMLVSAFGGHEHTMRAYREAVRRGYRLFSYGDAMVIR